VTTSNALKSSDSVCDYNATFSSTINSESGYTKISYQDCIIDNNNSHSGIIHARTQDSFSYIVLNADNACPPNKQQQQAKAEI